MAAENFKVKKGLEVGTAITATSSGVNVTGIVTATQFVGDGSGLTGVTGSGSGVVVQDEGSNVGTAATINFIGSNVTAAISGGVASVTVGAGGLSNVVEDTTPQLGGNLDLNGKFVNGTGGVNVTGVVTATTLKGNGDFVDIDVDGRADLDDVVVAGVSTFTGAIDANGNLDVDGRADLDDVVIAGVTTFSNSTESNSPTTGSVKLTGGLGVVKNIQTSGGLYATGTAGLNITHSADINGNLDVDGQTDLDDLVVSGVGTFSTRIDTNGVSFGTNTTTFAAKFADDAVANFGTDNDLKISHNDSHAIITNTKGDIVVSGIISATSDIKVGSAITMDPTSGIVTATKFVGDGSGLTGVTASGSGIVVKHDGSTVGTAGTINFSTNLDVTAVSAGIVTITASGGSNASTFTVTANNSTDETVYPIFVDGTTGSQGAESDTNLSYNPSTNILTAGTFSGNLSGTVNTAAQTSITSLGTLSALTVSGDVTANGNIVGDNSTNISGIASVTATSFHGSGALLTSLDADNLGSGTIPNGRFPTTLPAVSGANLTSLNATEITSGTLPIARIDANAVTFGKIQTVGTGVFLGRDSSGSGDIETMTAAEARTLLNVADGATAGITTASSNIQATWDVIHNSASAYRFTGPGQDGAENNPDIYLVRGHKYRFSLSSTSGSHPLQIRDTGGTAYTDGVTYSDTGNNRTTAGNDLDISVQHDAPAALKYHCTVHPAMVGNIYIVGQHLANGADNRVLTATSAYGMNGESNLTFDGTTLSATGQLSLAGGVVLQPGGTAWSTTNTRPQIQRQADGELRLGAGSDSSSIVTFYTSPSAGGTLVERLRIQSNGIVKVESNDSSGLSAHLLVNNSESNSGLSIMGSGSSFSSGGWAAVTDAGIIRSSANSSNGLVLQAASGDLRFYVGGNPPAERLRIDSNGKIGINVTNPGDYNASANNLVVHSSPSVNDAGITIRSNYAGTGGLYFADGTGTSSDKGYIAYGQVNDIMYFGVNRGGKLQINSDGAFGLSGSNYGSSGQVLTSGGSASAVSWSTPMSVLISSTTVSSQVSSVTFTEALTGAFSDYGIYIVTINGMRLANDDRDLHCRIRTGTNGATQISSNDYISATNGPSADETFSATSQWRLNYNNIGNEIASSYQRELFNATFYFYGFEANKRCRYHGMSTYQNSSGTLVGQFVNGVVTDSSATTGLEFFSSSGNIALGKFSLFGVNG